MDLNQLAQLSEQERADLYSAMEKDTALFARIVFPHILTENLKPQQRLQFENGTLNDEWILPDFHKKMYGHYDNLLGGKIENLGMILFRGAAKSTLKRITTIKAIAFGLEPCIVFVNESKEQASKDVVAVQDEIENNPILKALFGDLKGSLWNKESCTFNVAGKEFYLEATGMNSRIRGIHWKGQRPTLVFSDDFESETNSLTDNMRKKVITKINSQIMRMGDHKYKLVFMGTSIHPKAYLPSIRNNSRFKVPSGAFFERAISETPSIWLDPNSGQIKCASPAEFKIGTPTWKTRYGNDYIKKELKYYAEFKDGVHWWEVMQELYNVPKATVKPKFNADMIQPVNGDSVKFEKFQSTTYLSRVVNGKSLKTILHTYDGTDPAAGREEVHDNSIKVSIGITPTGDIIILDIFLGKIDIDIQADIVYNSGIKYGVKASAVETYGYQLGLRNLIKKKMKKGKSFILKDFNRKKSKNEKYKEFLITYINNGRVLYVPNCPHIDVLKRELAMYGGGEHDDTIDGLYLAIWASSERVPKHVDVDQKINRLKKAGSPMFQEKRKLTWQTI